MHIDKEAYEAISVYQISLIDSFKLKDLGAKSLVVYKLEDFFMGKISFRSVIQLRKLILIKNAWTVTMILMTRKTKRRQMIKT